MFIFLVQVLALVFASTSPPCLSARRGTCSVPPPLGRCKDFIAMGGTSVSFNGETTNVVTGSVGVSPGTSISGSFSMLSGTKEINTPLAIGCAYDFLVAWSAGQSAVLPNSNILQSADMAGLTLVPGVYGSASGTLIISAGQLYLDAINDPNAIWVFRIESTLITASHTKITLLRGALACNVYWVNNQAFIYIDFGY